MTKPQPSLQQCLFNTERLNIKNVTSLINNEYSEHQLTHKTLKLLSPKVTSSLPEDWQNINTDEQAKHWWQQQLIDSNFFAITLKPTCEIIGFLFLYDANDKQTPTSIRIGYLLGEEYWSQGYGSELIKGLVKWAMHDTRINRLIGGVDSNNIGSIKVLEKNGFSHSADTKPATENADNKVIFFELAV